MDNAVLFILAAYLFTACALVFLILVTVGRALSLRRQLRALDNRNKDDRQKDGLAQDSQTQSNIQKGRHDA